VTLPLGQAKDVLGYQMTYAGSQEIDGVWHFTVHATDGSSSYELTTEMFHSDYNNSTMRRPDYVSALTRDIYVDPISVEAPQQTAAQQPLHIKKGETVTLAGYDITFTKFDMQQHGNEAMMAGGAMRIAAVLQLKKGKKTEMVTVASFFDKGSVAESEPYRLNDTLELRFMGMNIDMEGGGSRAILTVGNPATQPSTSAESLVVEASVKPFMSLVWVGAFLCVGGAGIAVVRRRKDLSGSPPGTSAAGSKKPAKSITV